MKVKPEGNKELLKFWFKLVRLSMNISGHSTHDSSTVSFKNNEKHLRVH
jgi:hypothetical protein